MLTYKNLILNKTREYYFVKCNSLEERKMAAEELEELGFKMAGGSKVKNLDSSDIALSAQNLIVYTGYLGGDHRVEYYPGIFKDDKFESLLI